MASVTLENIQKTYPNGFKAIHGVDVDIKDGEFLVLVGPSGCGKSTLLRMIAGLETITEGSLKIGGNEVNNLEPSKRDIAMVFQNYALYPHMTVYNNMAYGLKIMGLSKEEIDQRVKNAASILELTEEQLTRKPRQLSGGQRQRVAMGRAIVRKPSVFLFDEPLSNLDAKLRVQMRVEIKQLQESLGITSVYVTHDQVEAMTLGHRLMVLNAGNVEQLGTPLELYDKPASLFVAGFIGSPAMNILDANISADGGQVTLADGTAIPVGNGGVKGYENKAVKLGIRPEHLEMSGDNDKSVPLTVTLVEHLGADTLLHGHFGNDKTDLTLRQSGTHLVKAGDVLPITITRDHIHLFDPETERRIEF
ncbi:sn-glycerol-3-phosphate ABC transporter ATP-binding protein UgpC [Sneathiella sp. P13V-1]|uniref:sn-glycerol-3-phosphate import ATP-binding protein UgpC n=1 Tax=Sneathiella sp. P13V-1 TaxID=2697366 RepID=UPI00187B984D|nr:sn-glycerol-3-phosphate import ATP-binding protein UgpC [Sneathiella sp. P13V-1]MBE7638192.1 sn-glycerol-3-phosphate ABC transporter ATP-binding protein UgpC [Sneathiella sp. P13V-1]